MLFKILHIILLASVKYFITLPYAMIIGLDYKYAILSVLLGGIGGFLFFYYLSKALNNRFERFLRLLCRTISYLFSIENKRFCISSQSRKRIFTRRNRILSRLRLNYGFWGIIIATPVILTIPLGAFLANKYYSRRRYIVLYMILSIITWGGVLSAVVHLFPNVFF